MTIEWKEVPTSSGPTRFEGYIGKRLAFSCKKIRGCSNYADYASEFYYALKSHLPMPFDGNVQCRFGSMSSLEKMAGKILTACLAEGHQISNSGEATS